MKLENGITLMALIITIIILLILAVVTINSTQKSDIINYAENAAKTYNQAETEEKDILAKYEDLISVGVYKQTGPIGEAENLENYGKKVIGFQSKGEGLQDIVWRVFYQDNKNVYLISERVNTEKGYKYYPLISPSFYKALGVDEDENNEKTDTLKKYNSGADVSIQGQELMPKAKAANLFTKENTNRNIIVTAYMCDIEEWDGYKDAAGKAVWAMGGPTIELYAKSFNSVKGETIIESNINERMGYSMPTLATDTITTDKNGIYRLEGIVTQHKKTSWYLASPDSKDASMNGIYNTQGKFNALAATNTMPDGSLAGFGMRPIVCVPVSNFDYELE